MAICHCRMFLLLSVLLRLSLVVQSQAKVLQNEQSLTEISDNQEDANVATKQGLIKQLSKTNHLPLALSKRTQTKLEIFDENKLNNVKTLYSNTEGGFERYLSSDEASIVDQNVNKVLSSMESLESHTRSSEEIAKRVNVKPTSRLRGKSNQNVQILQHFPLDIPDHASSNDPTTDNTRLEERHSYNQQSKQRKPEKQDKKSIQDTALQHLTHEKLQAANFNNKDFTLSVDNQKRKTITGKRNVTKKANLPSQPTNGNRTNDMKGTNIESEEKRLPLKENTNLIQSTGSLPLKDEINNIERELIQVGKTMTNRKTDIANGTENPAEQRTRNASVLTNETSLELNNTQIYPHNITAKNNPTIQQNASSIFRDIAKKDKGDGKQIWSSGQIIKSMRKHLNVPAMNMWGPWSTCSETCGTNGLQIRTRNCTPDDHACNGSAIDWKWCDGLNVCPDRVVNHDGNDTHAAVTMVTNRAPNQWGAWSTCSKKCSAQSLRVRSRKCPIQRSSNTGVCVQPTMQWTWCKPEKCSEPQSLASPNMKKMHNSPNTVENPSNASIIVIHTDTGITLKSDECAESPWGKWSKCTKTCGENSRKYRRRHCSCQVKTNCKQPLTGSQHCVLSSCPGEDNYGPWSAFSRCSKPCGGGWRKRMRRCKARPNSKDSSKCDHDLLIGVRVCNTQLCPKLESVVFVPNPDPEPVCGFIPCSEFGCIDNPNSKCISDMGCNPVFFNPNGDVDNRCRGWQRYSIKNPTMFCGFDPCLKSRCQSAFGRCTVDLNCKPVILTANNDLMDCTRFPYYITPAQKQFAGPRYYTRTY